MVGGTRGEGAFNCSTAIWDFFVCSQSEGAHLFILLLYMVVYNFQYNIYKEIKYLDVYKDILPYNII